jgi:hypothetical protein
MDRRIEIGVVADRRRQCELRLRLRDQCTAQLRLVRRGLPQRTRQRETQRRPRRRSHRHERIERRCDARLRRARGDAVEHAGRVRRTQVDDLVADRDSAAQRLARPRAAEHAERKILQRKITVRPIRRFEPARVRRIVRLVQHHRFFASNRLFNPCQHWMYSACSCADSSASFVGRITQRVSNINAIVSLM